MTELDDALRESFARLAEPGDPAGVVGSIRTRLDAGDTGTPANSSGFGGDGTPWLLWGAFVVVAALAGGVVGASGLVGHDTQTVVSIGPVALARTTPGYACPSGPAIGELARGARVLAVSRNDDASWISVRDPRNLSSTLWVPAGLVVVDADQGPVSELPLGAPCPVVSLPPLPVEAGAPPAPAPGPAPKPAAPDTVAPTITSASATPDHITCGGNSKFVATATDNKGVTAVNVTLAGPDPLTHGLSKSGSSWEWLYDPVNDSGSSGTATFTAVDAAGNVSAPVTIKLYYTCVG